MFRSTIRGTSVVAIAVLCASGGCDAPERRAPKLWGTPANIRAMHRYYDPSIQNAAAQNRVLGDGHFHPHSGVLNALGTRQLDRIRVSLERFGGSVHYETRSRDEALVAARLDAMRGYLTDTGMDMSDVEVGKSLSGGRGWSAVDALAAKTKALEAKASDIIGGSIEVSAPK